MKKEVYQLVSFFKNDSEIGFHAKLKTQSGKLIDKFVITDYRDSAQFIIEPSAKKLTIEVVEYKRGVFEKDCSYNKEKIDYEHIEKSIIKGTQKQIENCLFSIGCGTANLPQNHPAIKKFKEVHERMMNYIINGYDSYALRNHMEELGGLLGIKMEEA